MPAPSKLAIFIDAEPPSASGGGIRAYLKQALPLLQEEKWHTKVFTHNPEAYGGVEALRLARLPWPIRPWRRWAYAYAHDQCVAFGVSLWIEQMLGARENAGALVEFCDYDGLAYHSLKNPAFKGRVAVRVHTPLHRILSGIPEVMPWLPYRLLSYRENYGLSRAHKLTAPSPEFLEERCRLPRAAETLRNPPPPIPAFARLRENEALKPEFLFLGRWEPRKGLLELIHAFAGFRRAVPEARLTVIGDQGRTAYALAVNAALSEARRLDGSASWLQCEPAFNGDKSSLFSRFSVLLIPSLWENAPYVFYEALAHGVLALGSHTGDMGLAQSQTHGLRPKGGSPEDWTENLNLLWQGRDQATAWRRKQWLWLEGRREEAQRQLLRFWEGWRADQCASP